MIQLPLHLQVVPGLPTVAGREFSVIEYIQQWVARYPVLRCEADDFGNLTVSRQDIAPTEEPLYITAHLDHPGFVIEEIVSDTEARLRFRGGVKDAYFVGNDVQLWSKQHKRFATGTVQKMLEPRGGRAREAQDQLVMVKWHDAIEATVGQIATWDLPEPFLEGDTYYAPACDDLTAVAVALQSFESLLEQPSTMGDVRLLLTLAEEVGFVGAMEACANGSIPGNAWLINLENSSAQPECPVGSGPIVRVGDRMSIFNQEMLVRADAVVTQLKKELPAFKAQRRLMPGGACESTGFQLEGYRAMCICFPLGNYHNHGEQEGVIAPEYISLTDYNHMHTLLVAIARRWHSAPDLQALHERLRKRHAYWKENL